MFDYTNDGVLLAAMLDTRRSNKKGLYPVKIRITYKRNRTYYSTGKSLTKEDWDKLTTSKVTKLTSVRSEIQNVAKKVEEVVKELLKNDQFSFNALNIRLGSATSDTVNTAFTARIDWLKENGKISTADWYKYSLRSIKLFAGNQVKFNQITVEWLRSFERHLLADGKSYTSISMYMRALQVIMNEAKSSGIVKPSQHPFGRGKYEIPQHAGRNMALTLEQIGKIARYNCTTDTVAMCRDLWLFSYLCNGANITDICKLKYSNIRQGDVCFYRQKTVAKAKVKKLIQAVLTSEMQVIINRWGNSKSESDSYIFPFLKGDETPEDERRIIKNITHLMNDKMKGIGKALDIGHISTYTARHSFATVLKRSGANIAFISESLGHNDLKTTETYLATFEQAERIKNASLLTNF
jgi:integrase/recombinase XerD